MWADGSRQEELGCCGLHTLSLREPMNTLMHVITHSYGPLQPLRGMFWDDLHANRSEMKFWNSAFITLFSFFGPFRLLAGAGLWLVTDPPAWFGARLRVCVFMCSSLLPNPVPLQPRLERSSPEGDKKYKNKAFLPEHWSKHTHIHTHCTCTLREHHERIYGKWCFCSKILKSFLLRSWQTAEMEKHTYR